MRLIDENALREDWLQNGENEYIYDTNSFLSSLDGAPTIDPENLPIVRQLREELARVTEERDAAMSFIPKTCDTCKHGKSPCDWCWADPDGDLNWEWNGKRKEE